jgi:short-subunit dehydrogenase
MRDEIAVITGAGSGIGKAIALGLAAQGATLCLVGRDLSRLEDVAKAGRTVTPRIQCYAADLTLDEDIRRLAAQLQGLGRVDVLIHSAGFISLGRLESAPVADLDRHYRVNVRAPYALTQALLPLIKACQGQVVFINSSAGLSSRGNVGQYAASKHALKAIADSLRDEVNMQGIRVLSVYPGRTASPLQAAVHQMENRAYHPERLMQPEDVALAVINALGLPRSAEVTDIHIRPMAKALDS